MVGGEPGVYREVAPLLDCYARKHLLMGPAGSGQLTKAVNQICIAGLLEALAEGLHFAERAGLDAGRVVEVISQGAAQSWQMDNRAGDHAGRSLRLRLRGGLDAQGSGHRPRRGRSASALALPVAELVDRFYAELQQQGGGRLDTSSLIERLRNDSRAGRQ